MPASASCYLSLFCIFQNVHSCYAIKEAQLWTVTSSIDEDRVTVKSTPARWFRCWSDQKLSQCHTFTFPIIHTSPPLPPLSISFSSPHVQNVSWCTYPCKTLPLLLDHLPLYPPCLSPSPLLLVLLFLLLVDLLYPPHWGAAMECWEHWEPAEKLA